MSVVLKDVGYGFEIRKKPLKILKEINLQVNQGEFCYIYGPSGSGKTTLLQIIATFLHPSEGERILFSNLYDSTVQQSELAKARSRIGYLFQSPYLPSHLKVIDYLILQAEISGVGLKTAKESAISLSKSFDMFEFLQKRPNKLSGGEKQRIALLGTLLKNVDLLLLDEPTGSIDLKGKENLWEIILDMRNKKKELTIIAVSHDESLKQKSDESYYLNYGKLE